MGLSVYGRNISGEGPPQNATATLSAYAWGTCPALFANQSIPYNPAPGRIEDLADGYTDLYHKILGCSLPTDSDQAWSNVQDVLNEEFSTEPAQWIKVLFALEYALYLNKPSQDALNQAITHLNDPLYTWRKVLDRNRETLPAIVDAHDSDRAALALIEGIRALSVLA
jgi:hypothetical protein